MHMQTLYRGNRFVGVNGQENENAFTDGDRQGSVGADLFERGLCLPSDIKMTERQQDAVIEIIHRCFE